MTELSPMNPRETGFNGTTGLQMSHPALRGGIHRICWGTKQPWEYDYDFRDWLVWQESEPPHLFYCNRDGEWFELSFTPIEPCQ